MGKNPDWHRTWFIDTIQKQSLNMSIPKLTLLFILFTSFVSRPEDLAYNYIDQYRDLAVVEMQRSGVPASITLAQALHETNYGQSDLARKANNHFGIKCKHYWQGKTYKHKDDDYINGKLIKSCFRSYDSSTDSYIDHSNFLRNSDHYKVLFTFDKYDYKAWAHGLKSCGYATDKRYAEKLIRKIEKYDLDQYDYWVAK